MGLRGDGNAYSSREAVSPIKEIIWNEEPLMGVEVCFWSRATSQSSVVAGETTCPKSCSLATAVILSPVYTAVTWQWVYMSQYTHTVQPSVQLHRSLVESPVSPCFHVNQLHVSATQGRRQVPMYR
jgi:hypothetical protein